MAYRQTTIQEAREIWAAQPLFLDTETTGLEKTSEIIEVGVVDHKGKVLFESLIRPRRPVPSDATRLHGITNAMLQNAPNWLQVWPQLETLLRNRKVGTYNADFDLRMFQQTHLANGLRWNNPSISFFCVMKMYGDYAGLLKWARLEDAGRQLGISLPNSHRAIDDTLLARQVFLSMVNSNT
jgi:DNA polymerase-3 subunit epsilon